MRGEREPAYDFGAFRLDVAEQLLLRDGQPLGLSPKVFDVLRVLVQNAGHLVEKERLLAEVWPGTFVEEGALTRSISILRKTLGETGSEQKYIETVPKRGYRFVAPVTEGLPESSGTRGKAAGRIASSDMARASMPETSRLRPALTSSVRWALAAVIAAVLLIGGLFLPAVLGRNGRGTRASTTSARVHRQVTFTGKKRAATISPDGKRIAYVAYEKTEKHLVVQELAGGPPLTIFAAPELNYLRWSPDGTELIVWARGAGKNGVYILPQLGGTARQIASGQFIACWSPDGSTIAVASYLNGKIWFFDTRGQLQRTVSLRNVNWSIWDIDWSATGVLTFVSSDYQGRYTIWTVKPDGSEQRTAVVGDSEITAARWSRDGNAIYYLRRVNQTFSLLKLHVAEGGEPQGGASITLIAGLESDRFFALSRDGRRLVYARAPYYSNLWLVETDGGDNDNPYVRELTRGTSLVERPSISPDGTSIVFNIGHEPVTNLYTMPITGGTPKQLTSRDSFNLGAVWSADGNRIAFASTEGGQPRVWAVSATGGAPQALSSSDDMSETFDFTWAPGSRILYQQAGNRNYREIDPDTQSERLLVNDSSVGWMFSPVYSPDGTKIAVQWNRRPQRGIWLIDTKDHQGTLVHATAVDSAMPVGWSADARSIYVMEGKSLTFRGMTAPLGETITDARIVRLPVNGVGVKTVAVLPFDEIGSVDMTPDGRRFVCAVYSSRSDVWVVDNFDASP